MVNFRLTNGDLSEVTRLDLGPHRDESTEYIDVGNNDLAGLPAIKPVSIAMSGKYSSTNTNDEN
jgi:hypothetical protein